MSSPEDKAPTYIKILADILDSYTGPVSVNELAERLLAARPSPAKNPMRAMLKHIRHANGRLLVFLDADTILPIRLAFQGVRFRLSLDPEMANKGLVNIGGSLPSYLPMDFSPEKLRFVNTTRKPIPSKIKLLPQQVNTPFGRQEINSLYANLDSWMRTQKFNTKDHLVITILDWEQGILQLDREPFGQLNQDLLAQRDQLLAELFFDLLESAVEEQVPVHIAVPTAYARLPEKGGYPPHHWAVVLEADGRMTTDGWRIHYSDSGFSPLELLAREIVGEQVGIDFQHPTTQRISKEQGEQVYRFKAALANRAKIWREIELQGRHSLADLDRVMRDVFNHDFFDHMGGFWKLIPRGTQAQRVATARGSPLRRANRQAQFREVELGDVDPEGDGEGADTKIAQLDLRVGDKLKYVYDFGGWIEHLLTLESIEAPQAKVEYPREVARNEPQYMYCVECQKRGKQKTAEWICLECSDEFGQQVVLCEKCVRKHEDHYAEEILY